MKIDKKKIFEILDYHNLKNDEKKWIDLHWYRYYETLQLIPVIKNANVLEIGIGNGHLGIILKGLYNYNVTGTDILRNEMYEKKLKDKGINIIYFDLTKDKLPFDMNQFDIVIIAEVLEHLITEHPPINEFKKIHEILKDNGYIILSTPNIAALYKRLRLIIGENPLMRTESNLPSYDKHFREYTAQEISLLLKETGYRIEQLKFSNCLAKMFNVPFYYKYPYLLLSALPTLRDRIFILGKKI